jgi:hypothetical protein
MGKRIIISESEKKNILSLYEQDSNEFKKENDFLQKYIKKTFNVYSDLNQQKIKYNQVEIKDIYYDSKGLHINLKHEFPYFFFACVYNPSKISDVQNYWSETTPNIYAKTLISDINQKGAANGIKWCQKPKSDFGVKSVNKDTNF